MKLDNVDKKLLAFLYHNYRSPITEVAKSCRISRDQAEYRIEKYERAGLIKKYLTIFNYPLLGFHELSIVWFKTKNKEKLKNELEKIKNVLTVGEVISNYDLYADFVNTDKSEFDEILSQFLEENSEDILGYTVFSTTYAEFFPLKTFGDNYQEISYPAFSIQKKAEIDDKDISILKVLEKNGRAKIIELSDKAKITPETILYRLNRLRKNKVILGNRIQFNMEKLGFYFATLQIQLKSPKKSLKNKILSFCKNHKNINAVVFGISEYNCIIQIMYQSEEELRKAITDIKNQFREEINKDLVLFLEKEVEGKTLPFE